MAICRLFLLVICSCGTPEVEERQPELEAELPIISRIAGYDVAHLGLTKDDLGLAYQKMSAFHVLELSAIHCDSSLMAQTLADGVDPNTLSHGNHLMPEVAACPDNGLVLCRMMLDAGADVNGADVYDDNTLGAAILAGDTEVVALLLANGADPSQRDNDEEYGCRPIHFVKTPAMLEFLLGRGFSLADMCQSGKTLLHLAAAEDNAELIEYILENRLLDPAAVDDNYETAYDYATANASSRAQTLLHP